MAMQHLCLTMAKLMVTGSFLTLAACSSGGGDDNTVSGGLSVPDFSMADSDTNDAATSPVANDFFDTAQNVSNPVLLGGHVNVALRGANGSTYSTGDENDVFAVDLAEGQTIQLTIADPSSADLDLYLYSDASTSSLVDASTGSNQYEFLEISETGRYYLRVFAYSGASNYQLSIGLTATAQDVRVAERLSGDFVPGEILAVPLHGKANKHLATTSELDALGLQAVDGPTGAVRRFSATSVAGSGVSTRARRSSAGAFTGTFSGLDVNMQQKLETLLALKEVRASGLMDYAELNTRRQPSQTLPNDALYPYQWHYPQIALPQAWDITTGNSNAIVAVIDTGVLQGHPDLQGQLVAGYDFVSDRASAGDGNGIDSNPEDPGDGGLFSTSSFHGTHVAGTIAAATDNDLGVAGVAWGAKVMPVRALGIGGGTDYDIAQAVLFAAGLPNDSGTVPAQKAGIMNLSLGGYANNQTLADAISRARAAGVIVVAAAGNENTNRPSYPAALPGVVAVSAVDIDRERAPYSNYGSYIDVAAPGGNTALDANGDGRPDGILSTLADDSGRSLAYTLGFYQGTSMAAPHVAGVAALMKSVYPALTPADFDQQLVAGNLSSDIGSAGRDDLYGDGLINAYQAVVTATDLAGGSIGVSAIISATPQSLNLSYNATVTSLLVEKAGTGSTGPIAISADEPWLSVQAVTIDNEGLGRYNVSVNRDGLGQGTYTGTIILSGDTDTATVEVIMQVGGVSSGGASGLQYVLLVNAVTGASVKQDVVDTNTTDGQFSISGVDDGSYFLIAGSDMDNDGDICDAGEACGAWPTLGQPTVIEIGNGGRSSGLDFLSSWPSETPTAQAASLSALNTRGYALLSKRGAP